MHAYIYTYTHAYICMCRGGRTALHLAAEYGETATCEVLLDLGVCLGCVPRVCLGCVSKSEKPKTYIIKSKNLCPKREGLDQMINHKT